MLFDGRIVAESIISPRSFVGLMALYESNYLRLLHLIPDLEQFDGCYRSCVAGDCDLYVEVMERSRYTVTLALTYYFDTPRGRVADPDMLVRAYLDGQLAEAMRLGEAARHSDFQRLLKEQGRELGTRWQKNMVLNKWLDYLLEQGHLILER